MRGAIALAVAALTAIGIGACAITGSPPGRKLLLRRCTSCHSAPQQGETSHGLTLESWKALHGRDDAPVDAAEMALIRAYMQGEAEEPPNPLPPTQSDNDP